MANPLVVPGAYAAPPGGVNSNGSAAQFSTAVTIDGTPMRVAILGVSAAVALWALRKAGFKFNVGA